MRRNLSTVFAIIATTVFCPAFAQFNLDGQYIVRGEYRNGYNRLLNKGEKPAAFVGHRARLHAGYTKEAFQFFASIQDIRTWGNTPQANLIDNSLSVHEAWLQIKLSSKWSAKVGRQELNYDNSRFLGSLDWALQARAHDFALVKYESGNSKLHFGGGFNQDAMRTSGNLFTISNQYKAAQMVRFENTWGKLHLALLFWNDGRQYVTTNNLGVAIDTGVRYRQTLGIPALRYQFGKTTLAGFFYQQLGKDVGGRDIEAFDANVQVTQQFNFDSVGGSKLRLTGGVEILSGTATNNPGKNKSYSPLYGTNHAHNGYMDLFYVGGMHENSVGLQDLYLRARYDINPKWFIQLDGHLFSSHADVYKGTERLKKQLGTELDFAAGYTLNEAIGLQAGYSQFFQSSTYEYLQSIKNPQNTQNWAYLMVVFRPTIKNKFIGLLI